MATLIVIEGKHAGEYRIPLAMALALRDALNKPGYTIATVIGC